MTFATDLRAFAEKAGKRADDVVGEVVTQMFTTIDLRSPVGDAKYWKSPPPAGYVGGRFRANNQLSIGSMPSGTLAAPDPSGSKTVSVALGHIPEQAAGLVYFIGNNVPYAMRLEHGWSKQASAGVYGRTAAEFQKIVDEAVASAKGKTP